MVIVLPRTHVEELLRNVEENVLRRRAQQVGIDPDKLYIFPHEARLHLSEALGHFSDPETRQSYNDGEQRLGCARYIVRNESPERLEAFNTIVYNPLKSRYYLGD